jgi:hypothetical protein
MKDMFSMLRHSSNYSVNDLSSKSSKIFSSIKEFFSIENMSFIKTNGMTY